MRVTRSSSTRRTCTSAGELDAILTRRRHPAVRGGGCFFFLARGPPAARAGPPPPEPRAPAPSASDPARVPSNPRAREPRAARPSASRVARATSRMDSALETRARVDGGEGGRIPRGSVGFSPSARHVGAFGGGRGGDGEDDRAGRRDSRIEGLIHRAVLNPRLSSPRGSGRNIPGDCTAPRDRAIRVGSRRCGE